MKLAFIGLTVSSSWGNGHATTYRGLLRELTAAGHEVYFLEHDKPWYSQNRDFDRSEHFELIFYQSVKELQDTYRGLVESADFVIIGSYVPEGVSVCRWVLEIAQGVTAFYDIDTPVTLHKLDEGDEEYLSTDLIPHFDLYLSFSGGEVLNLLEQKYRAQRARALFCSVDPNLYYPMDLEHVWAMGYLGTFSDDRQPAVRSLMLEPARNLEQRKFVIAGPGYPDKHTWPKNVQHIDHLPPHQHCTFYNQQRITLNVTREAMVKLGFSPSVRLFEAAACGVPIVSDYWEGLTDLFEEGQEIFIAKSTADVISAIQDHSDEQLQTIGMAARKKVLNGHTAAHRAKQLLSYYQEVKKLVEAGDVDSLDI